MELSLEEAAAQLGKSARQVRYMIRNKTLPARKVGGRWLVTTDALPRSEGQQQAAARKHTALRDAVEGALSLDKAEARTYSVHQLKAFQAALPVHREASRRFGADHPITTSIAALLRAVARGCHRYERESKAEAYRAARDCASTAVCEVALTVETDASAADSITKSLEHIVLPAIAGLLRRTERARPR